MSPANVFWSGQSQAVRLSKAFRFDGTEVRIRREGSAVILEPMTGERGWLHDRITEFGPLDDDFVRATEEQPPMQDRPELDFFKRPTRSMRTPPSDSWRASPG